MKFIITICFLLLSNTVLAGGAPGTITMTLNGSATAVPSLSGSMLIVLSLLLFVVAYKVAKQKNASKLFVTLIGVTVLSTGLSGVKIISESFATGNTLPQNDYSLGQTRTIDLARFQSYIQNNNTNPMTVGVITSFVGWSCTPNMERIAAFSCVEGSSLPPGESCGVFCSDLSD